HYGLEPRVPADISDCDFDWYSPDKITVRPVVQGRAYIDFATRPGGGCLSQTYTVNFANCILPIVNGFMKPSN
ncbi:hypothetical protein, partial [Sulfitobacter sp. HI0129]|uniref:hypothetical protein n=1 Tax=Sulfitobacter sp. HI0129 TaxID=1822268 RepID=UPI001F33CD1C